ncbi:unknown [Crocosphaera subtropica ATCC 51142]|uniref:GUN4-like domain-containing protein n=1 Tax=Crocosphaera subtropica (strain ATCC 51142 / BH68) TaxID=43989 RepID=B1WNJ7_CROS5|nr:GUN4 domain-containing protein [Crocosphaera subtropica]ACB49839.1 unknown [Crocosphaera subtropica ATCC 51142]
MTDQQTATIDNTDNNLSQLTDQFINGTQKDQLQLIPQLMRMGEGGWQVLMKFLQASDENAVDIVRGKVYGILYQVKNTITEEFIQTHFPKGIISLKSQRNIDYQPLNQLLVEQKFQDADTLTRHLLCELAGEGAVQRKWVYFTEVEQFPATDLQTINALWLLHSEGKFGFSVQRKLWLSVGKDFTKLWPKIGWKKDNNWTQYPNQFTWDLDAPVGHLPLLNQLRGVRVTASLFSHPAWSQENS